MVEHYIDLQLASRGFGGDTMRLNGKIIGRSEQPIYAAARWLLANNAAAAEGDTLATYRGGTRCISGIVGDFAKLTVEESKRGNPTLRLARYRPFSSGAVAPRTGEVPTAAMVVAGHELEAVT